MPSGIRLTNVGGSPMFKTEYFSDGSAIVVTERGILLLSPMAKYEVKLSTNDPE
jgi:hypothetical protein